MARRSLKARSGANKKDIDGILDPHAKRIFRSLQTPKSRRAIEKAFRATPKQLGRAAVRESRKKRRIETRRKQKLQSAFAKLVRESETAGAVFFRSLKRCFSELKTIDGNLAIAGVDALGDEETAAVWFAKPHRELASASPYKAVASGRRDDVLRILSTIAPGISP